MKTHFKIGLITSFSFVFVALTTSVFAFEKVSDSELATLYGGYFYCDQDCEDSTDGCPSEIMEFPEGGSANCDDGCSGSDLETCIGGCKTTKDEECGDWHTQVLPGDDCNDTVPDVACQQGLGFYTGWCAEAGCLVEGVPPENPPSCSDCTREDCKDE